MKKFLFLFLFIGTIAYAQDLNKKTSFYFQSDPVATFKDGFNVSPGIEYQMKHTYVKAQVYVFPDLRGADYVEISGVPFTGINIVNKWETLRLYSGFKLGVIYREWEPNAFIGFEAGIDYSSNSYVLDGYYIGLSLVDDYRTDGGFWEKDYKEYWRISGFVRVGYKW